MVVVALCRACSALTAAVEVDCSVASRDMVEESFDCRYKDPDVNPIKKVAMNTKTASVFEYQVTLFHSMRILWL
jgi:hypothetical protein